MNTKPLYTAEQLARFRAEYVELCAQVAACPLESVRKLWEQAVINGLDTCDELVSLRREWNVPELTAMDVEAYISLCSAGSLTCERYFCGRTRKWFANRGIVG